jgi:hypothetical protein
MYLSISGALQLKSDIDFTCTVNEPHLLLNNEATWQFLFHLVNAAKREV